MALITLEDINLDLLVDFSDPATIAIATGISQIVDKSAAGRVYSQAAHAVQCQNRPATDQPWRDEMCGHTEYIVRGDK